MESKMIVSISMCWYNILCVFDYGAGQFTKISETFEYFFVEIMNLNAEVSTHWSTVCRQVIKKNTCADGPTPEILMLGVQF